ncbi:MAG: hypothetical protein ACFN0J_05485, partial [Segatella salivae]
RFCMVQKGQKEQKHASARCRKVKKKNYEESGFLSTKREGRYVEKWLFECKERYVEKWLSKVLKKSFVLLQAVARLP